MMYEMLTGENPFKITQEEELIKIIKDAVTFPSYANISAEAKDFVMCCLQKNPNDRKNIRELMHHDFFKKYPEKNADRKMVWPEIRHKFDNFNMKLLDAFLINFSYSQFN